MSGTSTSEQKGHPVMRVHVFHCDSVPYYSGVKPLEYVIGSAPVAYPIFSQCRTRRHCRRWASRISVESALFSRKYQNNITKIEQQNNDVPTPEWYLSKWLSTVH